MVESQLVELVTWSLAPGGHLLLQSNVEGVANAMESQFHQKMLFRAGVVPGMLDVLTTGRTETEAACRRSGRAVYRVLLQKLKPAGFDDNRIEAG